MAADSVAGGIGADAISGRHINCSHAPEKDPQLYLSFQMAGRRVPAGWHIWRAGPGVESDLGVQRWVVSTETLPSQARIVLITTPARKRWVVVV